MMKIFICEYEEQQLYNLIDKYLYFRNYDMKIETISMNSNNILDYIKKNNFETLYFIDISLDISINSIELVAKIKRYNPSGKIIFITDHTKVSYINKIKGIEYISKEDKEEFIFKVINYIEVEYKIQIKKRSSDKNSFVIKSNGQHIKIFNDDVNFIESSHVAHKLIIHTSNDVIEFYGTIKDLDKNSKNFFRCHKSYIVNISNIDSINTKSREIIMKNGQICYVSIRYIKKLLELFDTIQN